MKKQKGICFPRRQEGVINSQILVYKFYRSYMVHCVKSVQIRSFFWSLFSCIHTEYGNLRSIQSEYRELRTRKNSVFGHFSRSGTRYLICKHLFLTYFMDSPGKPKKNRGFLMFPGITDIIEVKNCVLLNLSRYLVVQSQK